MSSESKSQARVRDRIGERTYGLMFLNPKPDAVLYHILSFLETKCTVRTSILSKRWKNVWAYVPNLYLNDEDFSSFADFMAFVDRALLIRDSSAIQKFHLHCNRCHAEDFSRIYGWIRTAVRYNVVELDLCIDADTGEMFELPKSLLTCKTLMVWKLWSTYTIKILTSGWYPNLKFLHVKFQYPSLFNPDNDSMNFSHFPVLEYLRIDGFLGFDAFNLNVCVPALKTLRISLNPEYNQREAYNFLINAPMLEKLDVKEGYLSNYTFENTKSLVEANIHVFSEEDDEQAASANHATKFLSGISGVKYLTISSPFSTACSVAVFDNLRELKLVLEMGCCEWSLLIKFLERSSNLECLVLEHEYYYTYTPYCVGTLVIELVESVEVVPEVLKWSPPESVPNCLSSHLKTISIMGYNGNGYAGYLDEKELMKYLLKNGQVLQKLTIYTPGLSRDAEEELKEEFSMFEWGSKTSQVDIINLWR